MLLGRSLLLSLSSACTSFPGTGTLDDPHRFFLFRIAIWDHNVLISLISVGVWAGALALNIRSTSFSIVVVRTAISFTVSVFTQT